MNEPSLNGENGRGANGRFAAGNPGGPGNPFSKKSNEIRAAILDAIDPAAIGRIVKRVLERAETGTLDRTAVTMLAEILNRTIGMPYSMGLNERLKALEAKAAAMESGR